MFKFESKTIRKGLGPLFVVAVVIGAAFFLKTSALPSFLARAGEPVEEMEIASKTMSFRVEATGTLKATSVKDFGGPGAIGNYWQFKIVNLVPEGNNVKKGDMLIGFDAQKLMEDLQRYQIELDQANKELEKTKAQIELERQEMSAKLAAAENNYEKLKLKQRGSDLVTASNDVEMDRLALEQAGREVAALKDGLAWHAKSSEATYNIIVSKKTRAENKVGEIKRAIDAFQVRADRDGVAVYKTKWNGEKFKSGETVWSAQPVMEIPDLSTIVAEGFIPEVDIGKVSIGQMTEVTIDAFPGKFYSGKVASIGRLVRPKSWDIPNKVLEAGIALDNLDTAIMRPGMSVKIKIETGSITDCLAAPLKAVLITAQGAKVKLKTPSGWQEQNVSLGQSNGTEVVITEGLKPGDRIAVDFSKAR